MKTNKNGMLFLLSIILACCGALTFMIGFTYFFQSREEWVEILREIRPEMYPLFAFTLFASGLCAMFLPIALYVGRLIKMNRDEAIAKIIDGQRPRESTRYIKGIDTYPTRNEQQEGSGSCL